MFAIIQTGGKQYKVNEGDVIFVEKLNVEEGAEVTFDQVLAVSNDNGFVAGAPYVSGASVTAKVVRNGKAKKIYVTVIGIATMLAIRVTLRNDQRVRRVSELIVPPNTFLTAVSWVLSSA